MEAFAVTRIAFVLAVAVGMFAPVAVFACVPGMKCLKAPASTASKEVSAGDRLEPGKFQMIVNSRFYGLPPVESGMFYVRVGNRALKVKRDTYEVVSDVTHLTNRSF
jgi:hypothetical protein